jgi:DNA polymerase-3 subunit delta'
MYPWLDSYRARFVRLQLEQRLPHALLLGGAHQFGGLELAQACAASFLCEHPGVGGGCGQCHACQLMHQHSHPDCHESGTADQKSIGVDAIRQLILPLQKSAQLGVGKVVILDFAERMTEAAENALLKTLEEPAGNSLLILLVDSASQLLPTIVSRCQFWGITANRQVIEQWLATSYPQYPVSAGLLNAYQEQPLRLLDALSTAQTLPQQLIADAVQAFLSTPWLVAQSVRPLAEQWTSLHPWLVRLLLDALKYQQQVPLTALTYTEYPALVTQIAALPALHLVTSLEQLMALQDSLQAMPSSIPSMLILHWLEQLLGRTRTA